MRGGDDLRRREAAARFRLNADNAGNKKARRPGALFV
jgi:hypothetical protein